MGDKLVAVAVIAAIFVVAVMLGTTGASVG